MSLKKGIYNSIFAVIAMILSGVVSFFKISLIINYIGSDYNGLNNLYSQIFSVLMIGEAGIGIATTTLLYNSILCNDDEETNKIISGSRKILSKIIFFICIFAVTLSFFLSRIIKENNLDNKMISLTFVLFFLKAVIPVYLQPLKGYVAAKQDEYIINIAKIISTISIGGIEIFVIYEFKNFVLLLGVGIILTLLFEIILFFFLKKRYKTIKFYNKEKNFIAKNHTKELIKVNIVGTVSKSVDPIVISKMLGLFTVSIYSNYNYISNFIISIVGVGIGGFTHYFGNLFIKKDNKLKEKFDLYIILSNFIASSCTVIYIFLIQDFVKLWINKENRVDFITVLLFSSLIYIYILMKPMNNLIVVNRLFKLASNSALYETVLNLVLSLYLIRIIGLKGVLAGSLLSFCFVSFWYFPLKTYQNIFRCSCSDYFKKHLKSLTLLIILFSIFLYFDSKVEIENWNQFITLKFLLSLKILFTNILLYYMSFNDLKKYKLNILKNVI